MSRPNTNVLLLGIYHLTAVTCTSLVECVDVHNFGYFTRRTAQEMLQFGARTVIERIENGNVVCQPVAVNGGEPHEWVTYAQRRPHGQTQQLGAVLVAHTTYPVYAARIVLHKLLELGEQHCGAEDPTTLRETCEQLLVTAQEPEKVDRVVHIQRQLDDIKTVMHLNIDGLLKRGESLDELARISDALSETSKHFFQNAKRMNRCCRLY